MAEYRHYCVPHPQWAEFPKNLPEGTWVDNTAMSRERRPIKEDSNLIIEDFSTPARDGYAIGLRLYRPKKAEGKMPLFLYMHGGGFVGGGLETDDTPLRVIARNVPIVIVSVEYRLAPEHKFPVGFEDSFDVLRWVASPVGQDALSVDLERGFLLGGTSAGGNFAAGLAHLARDEGLTPRLTGLVFLASSFCHPDVRPKQYRDRILSVDEIDDAPGLTKTSIARFAAKYGAPPTDKRYSPLLFDSHNDLAKRVFFSICGWDPRRDEAILLEQILKVEGVETRSDIYPGLPHGFWTTCPELPVSKAWEEDLVNGLQWILG